MTDSRASYTVERDANGRVRYRRQTYPPGTLAAHPLAVKSLQAAAAKQQAPTKPLAARLATFDDLADLVTRQQYQLRLQAQQIAMLQRGVRRLQGFAAANEVITLPDVMRSSGRCDRAAREMTRDDRTWAAT